ncbi:MAG: hypothetical protein ABEI11_00155 [Haloarculaceae archaeon]
MGRPEPGEPDGDETDADVAPRDRVLAPVRTARETVEAERAEVIAERRAIEAFVDRVEALSTARGRPTGTGDRVPGTETVALRTEAPGADLAAVRTAYRETVMAVDHYGAVYGDDLPESLAAEFGPELAVAVGDGAVGVLTPQLRGALVEAADESRDDRARFVDTLDGELGSLRAAAESVGDLLARLDGGDGAGPAVPGEGAAVLDRLDAIAARRQERLNRRPEFHRADGHDLCSYLYADADWTYPVLAGVARFRSVLEARR